MIISPLSTLANPLTHNDMRDGMPPEYMLTQGQTPYETPVINWLTTGDLPPRQMGLNIHGKVPMIMPAFGESYYVINQRIDDIVAHLINESRRARARSIDFFYEMHPTSDIISILIHARITSVIERTLVRSVNFCRQTGDFLTIRDAMDYDIVPLADRILAENIRRSPENFYAAQSISLDGQAFFVTNRSITILFDEFQLSSMVSGVFPLELIKAHIQTATVTREELLPIENDYNLMMVPLGEIATQLGYRPHWCHELRRAEIWHDSMVYGSQLLTWMYPGVNEYHTPDMTRSLESGPYLRWGTRVYVPITFFEQILPLSVYSIDSFGDITFLAYLV